MVSRGLRELSQKKIKKICEHLRNPREKKFKKNSIINQ